MEHNNCAWEPREMLINEKLRPLYAVCNDKLQTVVWHFVMAETFSLGPLNGMEEMVRFHDFPHTQEVFGPKVAY